MHDKKVRGVKLKTEAHQLLFNYFQVILVTRHTPGGLSGGGDFHEDILEFAMTSAAVSIPGRNCVLNFYSRH